MLYHNTYTEDQKAKLEGLLNGFPLELIPTPTRWRCFVLPKEVKVELDTSKYEALTKIGFIKHAGTEKAERYNRAHGHLVATGDLYGHYHAPVVIRDYEDGVPTGERVVFPRTPTSMPEIGDHVIMGKWTGQFVSVYDPKTAKILTLKEYNDDELLAVADESIEVSTKTEDELSFID